jgi:L-alanine-DL-glutamate epimerase-like enolase superfamily enzyme
MKITSAQLLRLPGCCAVRLSAGDGLSGTGIGDAAAGAVALRLAKGMLVGADPRGVAGLWELLTRKAGAAGRGRAHLRAAAILDQALWDLKARAHGEPLWRMLGGARPRANAYASSAGRFARDADLEAWFARMATRYGLRGGKLRAGPNERDDLRRLGLVREALGRAAPAPELMIDAGRRWSAAQAVRRVRAIEKRFDLTWVEGIARDRDARRLKRLSDSVAAAVCVGAGFTGIREFLPQLRERSVDVVQIDVAATGITAALQLADAAYGLELPVTLAAVPGNVQAQVAGVMPNCMSVEITEPEPPDWLASGVRIAGGRAIAGDAPGNGLSLVGA